MVAVTGSNGLLGSFIVKKLIEEGAPVVALIRKNSDIRLLEGCTDKIIRREADVLNVPSLIESLDGVTTVIHAAALVSFNPWKRRRIFEVNVEGTKNVVNSCLTLGVSKLVHVSSVSALGRAKGVSTINEESKWINSPLNSDYGESKYLAELEIYRGMEEGLNTTIINPSAVLAAVNWDRSSARLFEYAWREKPFYTNGSLNYVDVRDVVEMIFRVCVPAFNGQKIIASSGVVSIKTFFDEVGKRFNKKPPSIKVNSTWTGLVARVEEIRSLIAGTEPMITRQSARLANETFYYDHQRAVELLHMRFRPLEESLDWCCNHYLKEVTTNK